MTHYKRVWYRTGDYRQALDETLREVGQAVTFTTIILISGFSVLVFSDHLGFARIGAFGSLAIFVALLSDLILIPAMIHLFKPDMGRSKKMTNMKGETA